jgi:hypothetical protein
MVYSLPPSLPPSNNVRVHARSSAERKTCQSVGTTNHAVHFEPGAPLAVLNFWRRGQTQCVRTPPTTSSLTHDPGLNVNARGGGDSDMCQCLDLHVVGGKPSAKQKTVTETPLVAQHDQ